MSSSPEYRGRFAPSPTGPLHFGSLVAAVGSYLDAKHHNGTWLVRVEDLDAPRCIPGAADDILRTLESFGLYWDEPVLYQSQRTAAYEEALLQLKDTGSVYSCTCTRKEIADSALHGIDGFIYPGTCRPTLAHPGLGGATGETTSLLTKPASGQVAGYPLEREGEKPKAWRVRTGFYPFPFSISPVEFYDTLQGRIIQDLTSEIGDFVVKRADGLFAYQLAIVVDDAFQGITHIVRGSDLLVSTPRQIFLQRLLGLPTPRYAHLPTAINAQGEKLSKQTFAPPVAAAKPVTPLLRALAFLRQEPPTELSSYDPDSVLNWAIAHWNMRKLNRIMEIDATG